MKKALSATLIVALLFVFLCASALATDYVKAVASPTYVRTGPGLNYKIVDKLSAGSYYEYGGSTQYDSRGIAWYSVYYFNGYGWVSSLHASLDSNRNGQYSNATSVYATREVNVRSGPGTNYRIIGTMYPGESADFTGFRQTDSRGSTWYQINYYGETGWVSANLTQIR